MSENTVTKYSTLENNVKDLLYRLSDLIIPQHVFAERIGVSSSTISNWISDISDEQPYGKYDIKLAILEINNEGLAITLPYRVFDVSYVERIKQAYQNDPGNRKYTLSLNSTSIKSLIAIFRSMGLIERGASDEAIEEFLCVALGVDELDAEYARAKAEELAADFIKIGARAMELKSMGVLAKAPPEAKKAKKAKATASEKPSKATASEKPSKATASEKPAAEAIAD